MASQILGALSNGFTSKQILDFLLRKFPAHSDKIKDALKAGFTVEQVINFLGGGREAVNQVSPSTTEHEQTRDIDIQRGKDVNQTALKGVGTAALAGGAALGAPMLQSALQRAAPQLLGPGSIGSGLGKNLSPGAKSLSPTKSGMPQTPMPSMLAGNQQNDQQVSPSQPPISPSIPPSAPAVQPEVKSINAGELLKDLPGLKKQIEDLSKNVKDPKGVTAILYNKYPKEMEKIQKKAGKPMEEVIAEYMESQPEGVKPFDNTEPEKSLKVGDKFTTRKGEEATLTELNDKTFEYETDKGGKRSGPLSSLEYEKGKIEKGSLASSPEGIGEVKEIRNGKAIIEVDGKKHQVDEDELEKPQYTEDEIADAYDRMFEMIPEEHRSGFIQWAGYNEDENSLGYIPRGGKYEKIYDITPEEARMIKEGKGTARTSGEEREGIWVVGEDTRGGVISQIVHDRRRKHEAVKKQQLEFPLDLPKAEKSDRGMKPIFDELAYPRGLSKARDKKKAEEERARKKAEKERLKKEKEDEKRKKKRQG